MKKLFGNINLTWKMVIISAIVIGVSVGLLNSVPFLRDTTITDIATFFDFWIFCGIFIIMNSKSNKDSALKCFIFFLISQPLIYLCEVPFNEMGWDLFIYYKTWFIWTLLCLPMGYIGYYIKKDKWYGLLILFPIMLILGMGLSSTITNVKYSFPKHLINTIFVTASFIIYPLVLFKDKKLRKIGLIINVMIMSVFGLIPLIKPSTYNTSFKCSSEELAYDHTYKAYLEDSSYGELSIKKNEEIDSYCIYASFKKPGDTKVILESPTGNKKYFNIHIGKMTYSFDEEEPNTIQNNDKLIDWNKDKITMKVEKTSTSKTGAILMIEDKNMPPISWDTSYSIQKLSEADIWYDLKEKETIEMLMKIITPDEKGITRIELEWKDRYGELTKGTYRIVKNNNFTTFYSETFNIN